MKKDDKWAPYKSSPDSDVVALPRGSARTGPLPWVGRSPDGRIVLREYGGEFTATMAEERLYNALADVKYMLSEEAVSEYVVSRSLSKEEEKLVRDFATFVVSAHEQLDRQREREENERQREEKRKVRDLSREEAAENGN